MPIRQRYAYYEINDAALTDSVRENEKECISTIWFFNDGILFYIPIKLCWDKNLILLIIACVVNLPIGLTITVNWCRFYKKILFSDMWLCKYTKLPLMWRKSTSDPRKAFALTTLVFFKMKKEMLLLWMIDDTEE